MNIMIILLLILLNGILSMTEMAFVSSRKFRQEADDRFLSTIQIGITLIAILTGLFQEVPYRMIWLRYFPVGSHYRTMPLDF